MRSLPAIILSMIVLWCACAHQVAPGGGPADLTPPRIIVVDPPDGSLRHPRTKPVTFTFAEWIDPKSAEKGTSIFPIPPGGVHIRAAARRLTIAPANAFADSTTYHIELNTGLRDLHNNAIGMPYRIVFTTGEKLDSCGIRGCVIDPLKRNAQPKVGLFPAGPGDSLLFGTPLYLAQTDSFGSFAITCIRKGVYRVIAFTDANSDNRFQPSREDAYAPPSRDIAVDSAAGPIMLFSVSSDTAPGRIKPLIAHSPRCIMGTWTDGNNRDPIHSVLERWRIEPVDTAHGKAVRVQAYLPINHSSRFALLLRDSMALAGYRLIYANRRHIVNTIGDTLFSDTIRFNGTSSADTVCPTIRFGGAGRFADLLQRIMLSSSEPVRMAATVLYACDTAGDTVAFFPEDTGYGDTVVCAPRRRLKPGMQYRIRLPFDQISDIGGNHPGPEKSGPRAAKFEIGKTAKPALEKGPPVDTSAITIEFTAIPGDNLCISLSAKAECPAAGANRWWAFRYFGGPPVYTREHGGEIRFDSIPGGKGTLLRFDDFDTSGRPTPGTLFPWRAPEPIIPYSDTLEARERWDISGISVPTCEECGRQKSSAQLR
jgi:hypothetical protein